MPKLLSGCRIMLVEDEFLICSLISEFVKDEGGEIVGPYPTVVDALKAAEDIEVDLAILDINIQGKIIFPVAFKLEERGIPFLFMTGYNDPKLPNGRHNWRVCNKPFRCEVLINEIVNVLQNN